MSKVNTESAIYQKWAPVLDPICLSDDEYKAKYGFEKATNGSLASAILIEGQEKWHKPEDFKNASVAQ